ncbi:MAG: hypothetical protein DRP35_02495 [Candidatus Zixiibacteriota bacterium]|nr:MAG: hypothetical protein DRP35_02495 [candidate division Zixibacteria bacterium]
MSEVQILSPRFDYSTLNLLFGGCILLMIQHISSILHRAHSDLRRTEHIYMILIALIIGLLGGLCSVGFRELIHIIQLGSWSQSGNLVDHIRTLPWWWKIGIPTFGGLLVGLIIHNFAREAKGHGVPEVMEAVALRGGRIRPRIVFAKMIASGICIATGGSVGREGPIVQIGSSLGSTIGQWLKISEGRLRTLVGCGAAAGIAATFNAPVAGTLFAVEVILGDFGVSQFSPIVISSVSATIVSRYFNGDFSAFNVPAYSLNNPLEIFAYATLGIIAGFVAVAFVKSLYKFEDIFENLSMYPPLKTIIGGFLIGLIALKYPEVLGLGYETIDQALNGNMIIDLLLILIVVKIFAVSITIGSGGSGGILAPSLFIGAMTGGVIGMAVNILWPGAVASPGAYALVGMGAVVAAGTYAPITAILIIFELTNDYKIILPLMISCIIATILAAKIQEGSIYTIKLLRRGLNINKGRSINVMEDLKVKTIMKKDFATVPVNAQLMLIVSRFIEHPGNSLFVINENRNLCGLITLDEIRPIMADAQSLQSLLIAKDLMIEHGFPKFSPDDSLAIVMKHLGSNSYDLPVLSNGEIIGSIWPENVIALYNEEIFKRDMASGMSTLLGKESHETSIPGIHNSRLNEIEVPYRYVGYTIAELNIRKKFGVTILLVRRKKKDQDELVDAIPDADTKLLSGDILLLMGTDQGLRHFELG